MRGPPQRFCRKPRRQMHCGPARRAALFGALHQDAADHADPAAVYKSVADCVVRPIPYRCIPPHQASADHTNDGFQNRLVIPPRRAGEHRKAWRNPAHLILGQQKHGGHCQTPLDAAIESVISPPARRNITAEAKMFCGASRRITAPRRIAPYCFSDLIGAQRRNCITQYLAII